MGFFQSIANIFYTAPDIEFRLQIIGFENAGKTTILQKMKLGGEPEDGEDGGSLVPTVPTIGVDLEELQVRNVNVKVWDLSGQLKLRNTWKYYYESVNGIIFVIDSTNTETLGDVRDTLHQVMAETAESCIPILVFANKQDVEGALAYSEIRNELALAGESERRKVRIQEASGLTNLGLSEGFAWIVD